MTLAFSRAEYEQRLRRTRTAMRTAGLDVLLVYHQEHMFYLVGYDHIGYWVYQALIIPADEGPLTAVVRKIDELSVRASGLVEDVRIWYDDTARNPAELTVRVLEERGLLHGKRVGIEKRSHALVAYYYDILRAELRAADEVVDASDLVMELRLIKSPAEIAYMRRAGEVMDAGVRGGFEVLRSGVRECDVHAAVMHAMYSAGGEFPAVAPPIASGPRTLTQTHGAATMRVVEPGDPFLLEVGGCVRRYHAGCMRMASIGPPSERMLSMQEAIRASTDLGLALTRPGTATADLARVVLAELEKHGYSRRGQQVGYAIGIGYPPTWVACRSARP